MHALISSLDEVSNERVTTLWEALASTCNLRHIFATPLPHFSWHAAKSYSLDLLEPLLDDWARQAEPFQVRTSGLGIFTGEKPIVHLRLVSTNILEYYHRQIWRHVKATPTIEPSPHYAPNTWLPHITLGIEDVTFSNLGCAINQLAFQAYDWLIQVNNLMVVTHEPDQPGEIIRQFQLGNNSGS